MDTKIIKERVQNLSEENQALFAMKLDALTSFAPETQEKTPVPCAACYSAALAETQELPDHPLLTRPLI